MKIQGKKGFSLFSRFFFAFLGVVIIICGVLAVLFYYFSKKSIESHIKENLLQQYTTISDNFEHAIKNDLIKNLHLLASNPTLDEYMMSSEIYREVNARAVERLFLQTVYYQDSFEKVYFVDYSGNEKIKVDRTGRVREYRDIGESRLFKIIESTMPGEMGIVGPLTGRKGVSFSVGISKIDADIGKFGGEVIIEYSLNKFLDALDKVKIFNINPVWVFAPDGRIVKQPSLENPVFDPRSHLSEEFQSAPELKVFKEGIIIHQDFSIIQDEPFIRLVISIPGSLLLRDTRALLRFLFYIFLFSIFGISLIAGYLSGYLSKPINELAAAAERLAEGNLLTKVNIRATGEVGILVNSFNKMAEDLEKTTVSKQYLDNLINSMIEALIVVGTDGSIVRVNDAVCAMLGFPEDELLGRSVDIIFGDDVPEGESGLHNVFDNRFVSNVEKNFVTSEGKKIPVLFSASVIYGEGGSVQGLVCVGQDITARKKFEEAILKSENKFKNLSKEFNALLDTIPDNLTLQSSDLKVLWANRAAAERLGMAISNLIGKHCYALWHKREAPCDPCPVIQTFITGEPADEEAATPDGRFWDCRTAPILNEKGEVVNVIEIGRDITENRRLEAQLLHAQKMEAIGTLTGGIAHDFNNILTAIMGNCNLLLIKMKKQSKLRHYVDGILTSSERAASLTGRLLTFSRKKIICPKPVRLNEIINRVEKLLIPIIGEDIELKIIASEEEIAVMADDSQIEQVLINLAANARDAMPEGGILLIETGLATLDDEFVATHCYSKPGTYACLSVSDTGAGITQDLKERIFEPFYTTKEVGKGTGLGLSITYGIVKQHQGYLTVYSEPEKGTTFKIYLPAIKASAAVAKEEKSEAPSRGAGTILLAEDNEESRKPIAGIIEEYGYSVIEAVDGEDALEKFMKYKGTIDLVILDVIMPKKNGKEVYDRIKKESPETKVLFTSGYTKNIIEQKGIIEEGLHFMPKPISPKILISKIRDLIVSCGLGSDLHS